MFGYVGISEEFARPVRFSTVWLSLILIATVIPLPFQESDAASGGQSAPSAISRDLTLHLDIVGEFRLAEPAGLSVALESGASPRELSVSIAATEGVTFPSGVATLAISLNAHERWVRHIPIIVALPGDQRIAARADGPGLAGAYRVIYVNATPAGGYVGDFPLSGLSDRGLAQASPPADSQQAGWRETLPVSPVSPTPTSPWGQDEFGYASRSPGSLVVKGRAAFLNENDAVESLEDVWVLVWDDDDLICGGGDDLLWDGLAGPGGLFQTPALDNSDACGTLDIFIEFRLETANTVKVAVEVLGLGVVYSQSSGTTDNVGDGTFDVGTLRPDGAVIEAATRIFHQISVHSWTQAALLGDDIGAVDVHFPKEDWPHYHTDSEEIHIPSGGDWDRAEDVIIHEHGHYVMDWAYAWFWPSPGGDHDICDDGQDRGLSWAEGFATAWALIVFNDPVYTWPDGSTANHETGTVCSATSTHHDHNEYRVAGALWDLFDAGTETYDLFTLGANEIWETLKAYNDGDYQDFFGSWKAMGFSADAFLMTAFQNTIDYDVAPTARVTQPASGVWMRGIITVSATASDSDNIVRYVDFWYTLDGSAFFYLGRDSLNPFSLLWDTSGINDDSVWIRSQSFDGMKNSLFDLSDASFGIDNEAPASAASVSGTTGAGGWFTSQVAVTLTATDALSGVAFIEYRVNLGAFQTYANPVGISVDGVHTVEFFATDAVGNPEALQSLALRIDTTPPAFASTSPSGFVTIPDVTVSWTADDATAGISRYEVSADGEDFQSVWQETSAALTLGDGDHVVVVRAVDGAGNHAEVEIHFTVDTNVFSPTGPYQGVPLYGLIVAIIATLIVIALILRRRR